MSRTGHLSVQQGKRVLVVMKDGQHFIAKFKQRRARAVEFYDHDTVATHNIRTLSIHKEINS